MAQSLSILLKIEDVASALITNKGGKSQVRILRDYLNAVLSGAKNANMDVSSSTAAPVAASGTFTLTSAVATDKVTIGTVDLTASSTPANENEWEIDGATDALDAASLAACINAHSVLSKVVSAAAVGAVVTITCLQKGVLGNQLPISSADTTIVASAAFLTGGTGGSQGAAQNYSVGL